MRGLIWDLTLPGAVRVLLQRRNVCCCSRNQAKHLRPAAGSLADTQEEVCRGAVGAATILRCLVSGLTFSPAMQEDRALAALQRVSTSQECPAPVAAPGTGRLSRALRSHRSSSISLRQKVDECLVISSEKWLEPDSFPFPFSSVWPVPKRNFGKIKLITWSTTEWRR